MNWDIHAIFTVIFNGLSAVKYNKTLPGFIVGYTPTL